MADKLKLSELIRIGAKLRPQCIGWTHSDFSGVWKSCAIGAAIEAKLGQMPNGHTDCDDIVNILGISMTLMGRITQLNDKHGLTREQIADILEAEGL